MLSILVFLFGCAYYNSLFNAKKNYNAGIEAILNSPDPTKTPPSAKKYFETAIEKSWKLIDIYGDNSKWADDALLYIAKSEYHLQKYTQSKVHLEQFMNKYPKSNLMDEVNLWYGKAMLQLDDYETANEYFLRAINNSKDAEIKSEAYFELGNYEFENENYKMAQEYFIKALKEKPNDQYRAALYFYLGETFYIQKDYENAIKQYKKVEKYSPTLDIEYQTGLHLAKSYAYLEKYIKGIKFLRKMLTAPRFKNFVPSIKTTIGEIYAMGGMYDDAVYIYKETITARKSGPGTAQASLNLARLYETVYHDVDSAVVYYGKVKALYSRYDSVKIAEDKKIFLSELKDIRDAIHRDQRLVYKLTTDEFFRDSLFQAQYEDSIRRLSGDTLDTVLVENRPPPQPFWEEDSLQQNPADSAIAGNQPPGGQPGGLPGEPNPNPNEEGYGNGQQPPPIPGQEGTNPAGFEGPGSQNKNKKQKPEKKIIVIEVERRKLPQIEEDLKISHYQIAEYFLLKVEDYDSAAFYFNKFVNTYDDSLLTPKALYSLRLIYTQEGYRDSLKVDSLENVILQRYPETV
ncbi:MAG: tetratricopeptide repeat protein, partial [Calditrichia bacterium]